MKYALYQLSKAKGKKEYQPLVKTICPSLKAALEELNSYWDDCLDSPVWYNKRIGEFVAYKRHDRMLYVPNVKDGDEDVYGRLPIYYVDVYPNPFTNYILRKKRGLGSVEFSLEGVK